MSKGSKRRPAAVPPATVDANYERMFLTGVQWVEANAVLVTRAAASDSNLDFRVIVTSDRTDAQG